MAKYTLFVLKVPLNTNKASKVYPWQLRDTSLI